MTDQNNPVIVVNIWQLCIPEAFLSLLLSFSLSLSIHQRNMVQKRRCAVEYCLNFSFDPQKMTENQCFLKSTSLNQVYSIITCSEYSSSLIKCFLNVS